MISTDISPVMVEAARRRGIPDVEHRVMDMQAIDLPDSSVDGVVSRYGYMLVPDPALALRETRRVLKPGGRLAFATWAPAKPESVGDRVRPGADRTRSARAAQARTSPASSSSTSRSGSRSSSVAPGSTKSR